MASAPGYSIDTNILLRLSRLDNPLHRLIKEAIDQLTGRGSELYFSLQNIAEFWNVCTRPADRNGFGLAPAETDLLLAFIERKMTFLPDSERVYSLWREIVLANDVRGVQVHDARLAAIMRAYGVPCILTLNQTDFLRYDGVQAVHPNQVRTSTR